MALFLRLIKSARIDKFVLVNQNLLHMKIRSTLMPLLLVIALLVTMSFHVLPTSLRIEIRNNLGNIEENVKVQLFKTKEDYRNETNVALARILNLASGKATSSVMISDFS